MSYRTFFSLLLVCCGLAFTQNGAAMDIKTSGVFSARDDKPRRTLSLNAGVSAAHYAIAFQENFYSKQLDLYIPAIQLMYDQNPVFNGKPVRWMEVGGLLSYEYLRKKNPGYFYYKNAVKTYEDYSDYFVRYHASLSARFLYVRRERFEMYSGIRLGALYWSYTNNSGDTSAGYYYKREYKFEYPPGNDIKVFQRNKWVFDAQVQLLGMRVFFHEKFGMNLEICAGAPHTVSAGFNFRW